MYTLYGIPNCDTVRKAIKWLNEHGVANQLHNFKKEGITEAKVSGWAIQVGVEKLLNKKGTTWRGLDKEVQATADTEQGAIALMVQYPTLIKRPVVEQNGKVFAVGFDADTYAKVFADK